MREIFPGVWHWTAMHEPLHIRVSSYYVAPAAVVIDPKVPEDGLDALPGRPQQILLTSGHHGRDCAAFADAFGIPVRGSREAAEHLGDSLEVDVWTGTGAVAPGITPIHIGKLCPDEGALHIAVDRGAIAIADAIFGHGGALSFPSDALIGDNPERVRDGLKDAYRGVLERDFDHLLFAHGEPVVGGGRAALRAFLDDGRP